MEIVYGHLCREAAHKLDASSVHVVYDHIDNEYLTHPKRDYIDILLMSWR